MAGKERMTRIAKGATGQVDALLADIRGLILAARRAVVRSVDTLQVLTNFEIGRRIVEHEQQGVARAEYGKRTLGELAERLTEEFGRGFSRSNLEYMRKFFLAYRDRLTGKSQMVSGKLQSEPREKSQALSGESSPGEPSVFREGTHTATLFCLSWSQYVFLLGIDNEDERAFYEIESARNGWTLPELKRQFNASLYERLALSRDKRGIRKLAQHGQIIGRPHDILKEPYVLEFLGLDEKAAYSETDLESAIIDKLEHFLLELGKGFLFEARQKRFTFDAEPAFGSLASAQACSARSKGRARIETSVINPFAFRSSVAPARKGGRGLKLSGGPCEVTPIAVAPARKGGRGLKQSPGLLCGRPVCGSARSKGRARIETWF